MLPAPEMLRQTDLAELQVGQAAIALLSLACAIAKGSRPKVRTGRKLRNRGLQALAVGIVEAVVILNFTCGVIVLPFHLTIWVA